MERVEPRIQSEISRYIRIKKVRILEGTERRIALNLGCGEEDLVLVKVEVEKIEGDPISWLEKRFLINQSEVM
jgi:hypothetical protein